MTVVIRCSGNEPIGLLSKTKYLIPALTAANFNASITAVNALAAAEIALSHGILANTAIDLPLAGSGSYPTGVANRGQKFIVTASNANGRKFTYTIPAANDTIGVGPDGRTVDLTNATWATYVTAFHAIATDPAANALTVDGAVLGGRRR
jgi:hypothetical protein